MRLHSLVAENFRAFPRLSLDLHPQFTLIIGANGAGKSSVLDALAVALGAWLLGFPDVGKCHIERDEMRWVLRSVAGEEGMELAGSTTVSAVGTLDGTYVLRWSRSLRSPTGHTSFGQGLAPRVSGPAVRDRTACAARRRGGVPGSLARGDRGASARGRRCGAATNELAVGADRQPRASGR
jgi:hypothetical protein